MGPEGQILWKGVVGVVGRYYYQVFPRLLLALPDPSVSPMQILVLSFMILNAIFITLDDIKTRKCVGFMVLGIECWGLCSIFFFILLFFLDQQMWELEREIESPTFEWEGVYQLSYVWIGLLILMLVGGSWNASKDFFFIFILEPIIKIRN